MLTTARSPDEARLALAVLEQASDVRFDVYMFDLGYGPRVLINDRSPKNGEKAFARSVERDEGLESIETEPPQPAQRG